MSAGEEREPKDKPPGIGSFLRVPEPETFVDRIPVVGFLFALYKSYSRRNGPLLSAGIAYYALFSMGPLVLLTVQLAGTLLGDGPPTPESRLADALEPYVGPQTAALLASLAVRTNPSEYALTIVGLGILLYGATRLFVRLQASFNIMWDVRVVIREFSLRRLLSRLLVFGMILIPTVLLLVALALGSAVSWLGDLTGREGAIIQIGQALIPFVISWLALLVVFVVLPDIKLSWRDCWFSSLLVAIAWTVGTALFGLYLGWSGNQQYSGTVGALLGAIVWVDVLSIMMLIGVRFNKAIYVWRGKRIRPYYYAALITELPDAKGRRESAAPPTGVRPPDAAPPPDEAGPQEANGGREDD